MAYEVFKAIVWAMGFATATSGMTLILVDVLAHYDLHSAWGFPVWILMVISNYRFCKSRLKKD